MAYKAGSKIICEVIRSKFYPTILKNIDCNCRLHHALGKAKQFNRTYSENILLPNILWRGFMQSIIIKIVPLPFLSPGRYVFGCFSKFSSGPSLPPTINPESRLDDVNSQNEQNADQVAENQGPGRLSGYLVPGDVDSHQDKILMRRRNLNEIAFKQKQDLTCTKLTSTYSTRLKAPSRFSWKVPMAYHPFKTKNQLIQRKNLQSEIDFTDNLSTFGDIRERLNPHFQRNEEDIKLYEPVTSKFVQTLHQAKGTLKRSPVGNLASSGSNKMQEFRKLESVNIKVNKERTKELFRRSGKVPSGDVSSDSQIKSSVRSSIVVGKDKLLTHRHPVVRSLSTTNLKSKLKIYAGPVYNSSSKEYVKPEGIPSFSSNTSNQFQDLSPRFRLKRDLISVEANTRRVPIIQRRAPINSTKSVEDIQLTPQLSLPHATSKQKQPKEEPHVKTWNFAPKRKRLPIGVPSYERYTYKVTLNPSGTGLRQTIVLKTPKYNLSKREDYLRPPIFQQRKISVVQT